jgi:hypothetical protein
MGYGYGGTNYGYSGIDYGYGRKNTADNNIATEEPTPNESSFGATGNANIDVVLEGSKWEFLNDADRILDWGIIDGSAHWLSETVVFEKISYVLDGISQFINVGFNFVDYFGDVETANASGVELNYIADSLSASLYGYANFPSQEYAILSGFSEPFYELGDVHINTNIYYDLGVIAAENIDLLIDFQMTVLHETGHALGLKHPFHEGSGGQQTASQLNVAELIGMDSDQTGEVLYSVMSYASAGSFADAATGIPVPLTPMIHDIAALQYLYGENESHNNDDTIYEVNADWFDYYIENDTGGIDTIDGTLSTEGLIISMNMETSIVNAGYITKTYNVGDEFPYKRVDDIIGILENATGSEYSDFIYDGSINSINNVINGLGGDDYITYSGGNDTVDGGDGDDTLALNYLERDIQRISEEDGVYSLFLNNNTLQFQNIETIRSSDGTNFSPNNLLAKLNDAPAATVDLAGTVVSRGGGILSDVAITADISNSSIDLTTTSSNTGTFAIEVDNGASVSLLADMIHTNASPTKAITPQDALEALRLSVGLTTIGGSKTALDFMAADFNQNGKVTPQDALDILKYSVGLRELDTEWMFIDSAGDYSGITKSSVSYTEGVSAAAMTADLDVAMMGILLGDVNDTYTGYLDIA